MRRAVRHLTLLALIAAACTSSPDPPDAPSLDFATGGGDASATASATPSAEPTGQPMTPSDLDGLGGRLAILDAPGNLVTMDPDGSNEMTVAEADPGSTQVRQPAWSRDGERLAWVHVTSTGAGAFDAVVSTSTPDGADATEAAMGATVPFFLSWDPTSSRVAYLGPSVQDEIEFGVVEVAGRPTSKAVDGGAPFYLSWAPSGDELLVHVGTERLERLGIDGRARAVGQEPGTFNVPVWSGDTLLYAAVGDDGQRLVGQDVASGRLRTLVPFEGAITFVASPDGERVAFQIFGERPSALSVVDLDSGNILGVVEGAIASYFWSPDGERLLYLEPVTDREQIAFRWGVWDGETTFTTEPFLPSQTLVREYLPFFEQYAQVISLWSPDGRAFAYPGQNAAGETGIWVQEAIPDRAPVLVSDGAFVTWSPA